MGSRLNCLDPKQAKVTTLIMNSKMQIMLLLQVLQIILGASAGLRKATINFIIYLCPSICLSVSMEQLDSHWTHYHYV